MNETAKASERRKNEHIFKRVFRGHGIDIGCGGDVLNKQGEFPLIESCKPYDARLGNPDAQYIHKHENNNFYDFVYSSHCLEHMKDPSIAIVNWGKLVKPLGYLVVVVPDEDLYEQNVWPSIRNRDHKSSFTIYKERSWCKESKNIFDIAILLSNFTTIRISQEDTFYDYNLKDQDQTLRGAECNIEYVAQKQLALAP
jgi:predicted SAM-dependent methyltransferase